jgi:hypothetical protein
MEITMRIGLLICLLASTCASADPLMDTGELKVRANMPLVIIETQATGRNFIRLPSLDYTFEVDALCRAGLNPALLSLSVADTRRSLSADDLLSTSRFLVSFTVPATQIGPIAVDRFCLNAENEHDLLTIPSVLSVQASLLCTSDTDKQMIYASASLDVALKCGAPANKALIATD